MNTNRLLVGLLVLILVVAIGVAAVSYFTSSRNTNGNRNANTNASPTTKTAVTAFASADDFKSYLLVGEGNASASGLFAGTTRNVTDGSAVENVGGQVGLGSSDLKAAPAVPDRFSTTNVQVQGIDEPDIVKTDGTRLFVSSEYPLYYTGGLVPLLEDTGVSTKVLPPDQPTQLTKILTAFPPESLAKIGSIERGGNLLLSGKMLIVFTNAKLYGYDVTEPATPKESWTLEFPNRSQLVSSRLMDGKIYFVTSTTVSHDSPCPLTPFQLRGVDVIVPCGNIYHPVSPTSVDVTYTASVLDAATGQTGVTKSFVGSAQSSAVSMSKNALYVTYSSFADPVVYLYDFYSQAASDLLPASTLERLQKLSTYDLSTAAKMTELEVLFEQQLNSLSDDARLKLENDLENRMKSYQQEHRRSFEKTGIVKLALPDLTIAATGEVPGQLLNQFSLDEYQNTLRVATTSGGSFFSSRSESMNDVYALDGDLTVTGSVLDLGKGERIYSVRFLGSRGYVVTFKQTDPFYVIDFKNPAQPTLAGELKIPGYSSYLDPLTDDLVVGIGEENGQVKASLFDVSDAKNPQEVSKYSLKEYWTDVGSNHHAFLKDPKHEVFFLPAGQNGYVFSYKDKTLTLAHALSGQNVRRAVYINDNLYVVTATKVSVLKESDWSTVKELEL